MERSGVDCFGSSLLTATKTSTNLNIMKNDILKEMDIIPDYEGREWQVVSLSNASEPGSVGEPEILYRLMDRHGNVKDVMDYELDRYNAKKGQG